MDKLIGLFQPETYLHCMTLDTGATMIGILQLNATLFFFGRTSQLSPFYFVLDFSIAFLYIIRAMIFLQIVFQQDLKDQKTRHKFYAGTALTTIVLAPLSIAYVILRWLEWNHFPMYEFLGFFFLAIINVYHLLILRAYSLQKDYDPADDDFKGD